MEQENQKGQFNSNFGFLMAALGSAVGLGNLWSFPYKIGIGGGFAFLLLYIAVAIFCGYPLMLSEIAIGRKTQKAAIEAYRETDSRFTFNGILQTIVPFCLICFYCTFGGYICKYLWSSIIDLFTKANPISQSDPGLFFHSFYTNMPQAIGFMLFFVAITSVIVLGGVSGGIERFCKYAMPALFFMLLAVVIRACTLPGAGAGLSFIFKPDVSSWGSFSGFLSVLGLAGGQCFFSLSLASGCLIAYGSYLAKDHNVEKDAAIIVFGDSLVAVMAAMAVMPSVFAFGLEPSAGPGLLFVSLTTVFQHMGFAGKIFQLLFWALVFIAALSSSIGMMEGAISAIMDTKIKAGKKVSRFGQTMFITAVAVVGNLLVTCDQLGEGPLPHILGRSTWLDVFDMISEGILMPLTGLIMAILLGWVVPHYLDDEVKLGSDFKTQNFYNFCIKWIGPVFMILIVYSQFTAFF